MGVFAVHLYLKSAWLNTQLFRLHHTKHGFGNHAESIFIGPPSFSNALFVSVKYGSQRESAGIRRRSQPACRTEPPPH
jgi:hypothetical protein